MIRIELLGLVILSVVLLSAIGTVTSSNKGSIVVAGNFSIGGRMLNLAQYDLTTGEYGTFSCFNLLFCEINRISLSFRWSPTSQSELFLYGENNGVIWDIAINRTSNPYDSMYIVGAFDTDTPTSQLQLCSVSCYDGSAFSKVDIHTYSFARCHFLCYTLYCIILSCIILCYVALYCIIL